MKKYHIIYADPAWFYNDKRNTHTKLCGGARVYYDVMKTKDICELPIQGICEKDCVLFLWATPPCLKDAIEVVRSWGFVYKTFGFVWIKQNKKDKRPCFGIGYYTKSNTEICLLATKGKIIKPATNKISQLVFSPRQKHSEKPQIVRNLINQLYPKEEKIELFARKQTFSEYVEGWDATGLEYDGQLIQEFLLKEI